MSGEKTQFGIVRVGDATLAVELRHFSEVFRVEKEERLPQSSQMLRGGVRLRGQLIPVLALDALGKLKKHDEASVLGVILEHDGRLLAFLVDDVLGITSVSKTEVQSLQSQGQHQAGIFDQGFQHDGVFACIFDVAKTMQIDGVYSAAKGANSQKDFIKSHQPVMIFEAGQTRFCLPAVEIYAAIPRRQIEETALTSGPCLGEITYHNRRIPVICPVETFGLGSAARHTSSEIVALRFPGDLVLGLAVDAIHQIGTVANARRATLPLWMGAQNYIETVLLQPDQSQLFALDLSAIHGAPALAEIAKFSKHDQAAPQMTEAAKGPKTNIAHERHRGSRRGFQPCRLQRCA